MKNVFVYVLAVAAALTIVGCQKENPGSQYKVPTKPYEMVKIQKNTSIVLWDSEDYDFETGNAIYTKQFQEHGKTNALKTEVGAACSSWRNGRYHGRNLDWRQEDYGCLIIQMPKGSNVKHASVALLNGTSDITQDFISRGEIDTLMRVYLPCAVVDGINDAGVAVNTNIVIHTPGIKYVKDGNLSNMCVVRYVLDNAGSVDEAISLLRGRKISQDIIELAGDETHYMISDKSSTAVVEFKGEVMNVIRFNQGEDGCLSGNGTPAIMTNLYNFAVEDFGIGTDNFFNNHVLALGVERWKTIQDQYPDAANSVEDNFNIAQSVWCCKGLLKDKKTWYTELADQFGYGKDEKGWYYKKDGVRIACDGWLSAQKGFWDYFIGGYWKRYEDNYGNKPDPHIKGNTYWETSHSVIYDLESKKGYLYPFENFYSNDGKPIVICLPK